MDSITETKKCTKCGIVKSLKSFYRNRYCIDGHKASCRKCDIANSVERRARVQRGEIPNRKRCKTCKEEKSVDEYYVSIGCKDGYRTQCKRCVYRERKIEKNIPDRKKVPIEEQKRKSNLRVAKFKNANREKVRKEGREYYAQNRERILVALAVKRKTPEYRQQHNIYSQNRRAKENGNGGSFTVQEWVDLCNRYDNVCLKCKRKLPLTHDHVIPVSKGGTNYISNIQPLCLECNVKKNARTIDYRY